MSSFVYRKLTRKASHIIEEARKLSAFVGPRARLAARWSIGRLITEYDQGGKALSIRGDALLERLSRDLTRRHGRGYSIDELYLKRAFYHAWPPERVWNTASRKSPSPRRRRDSAPSLKILSAAFPLSWSHYTRLIRIPNPFARNFLEEQAVRRGWSARDLRRQAGPLHRPRKGSAGGKSGGAK